LFLLDSIDIIDGLYYHHRKHRVEALSKFLSLYCVLSSFKFSIRFGEGAVKA